MGLTTLPCKMKIVEKHPRNSAGFCGGGQGLSWAVEPRKEEEEEEEEEEIIIIIIIIIIIGPNITFCGSFF
jgi:hypothetical protein